jgi:Resolvase, N terminal domain
MKPRLSVCNAQASATRIVACLAVFCLPAAGIPTDLGDSPEAASASAPLARGALYGQPQGEPRPRTLQLRLRARADVLARADRSGHGTSRTGMGDDRTRGTGRTEWAVPALFLGLTLAFISGRLLRAVWLTGRDPGQKTGTVHGRPVAPRPLPSGSTERPEAPNGAAKAAANGAANGAPNGALNEANHAARKEAKSGGAQAANPPVVAAAPLRPEPGLSSNAPTALGYVSIREPDGAREREFQIQLAAIDTACRDRSLVLKEVVRDVEQGDDTGRARPGIEYALRRLACGDPSCLVVAELGRLSRSTTRLGYILEWLRRREARLVSVDEGLDTATKSGCEAAKRLMSRYVSEGQPPARLAGPGRVPHPAATGKRMRRLASVDRSVLKERIRQMRASGMTLQAIADRLNDERVPTLRGGAEWRPSAVKAVTGYRRPDPAGSGENAKGSAGKGRDLRDVSGREGGGAG